jgi:hypothetical protein
MEPSAGEDPTTAVGESPTTVVGPAAQSGAGESPTTVNDDHPTSIYPTRVLPALPAVAQPPGARAASPVLAAPALPAVAQPPGWFPDPWSAGVAGKVRYWDGSGWTGYAADTAPVLVRPNLGAPGWLLGVWSGIVLLVSAGIFPVVVVMGAFACDSGWDGCSTASSNAIVSYALVALVWSVAPAVLAVIIGRGRRLGRVLRIIALVLIPLAPVLGVVVAFLVISSAFPDPLV